MRIRVAIRHILTLRGLRSCFPHHQKGMERRWQRLRAARSEAVHAALDHATAATAEAEGHVAELRAKGPEKAGAPAMIPSAMSAGDAAMCSESGSAGTLSASGPHQAVPPARRRRRGGGVEHRPVRGSHGDDAEGGQGDGAVLQWQCQVTRPGRVMPHPVSLTLSDSGLLLQVRSCSKLAEYVAMAVDVAGGLWQWVFPRQTVAW